MLYNTRRLYPRGSQNRGLAIDAEGAMLGPDCILVRRAAQGYRTISREEGAMLQEFLLGKDWEADWLFERCRQIACALAERQVALAQIRGLHIPIGDLDTVQLNQISRAAPLIKANYNPGEPRVPMGQPEGGEWTNDGATFPMGSNGSPDSSVGSDIHAPPDSTQPAGRLSGDSQGVENSHGIDPDIIPAAYQGYYHDKVVEDFRNYLIAKGGAVITAVPLNAVDGSTAVADMIVKMPNEMPFVIEG